jgi:hypothetical protein
MSRKIFEELIESIIGIRSEVHAQILFQASELCRKSFLIEDIAWEKLLSEKDFLSARGLFTVCFNSCGSAFEPMSKDILSELEEVLYLFANKLYPNFDSVVLCEPDEIMRILQT